MNHDDVGSGMAHLQQIFALAERLQSCGVAICEHHWELSDSGSWILVLGWSHRWFEFSWAGRECIVSVSESWRAEGQTAQHCSALRFERLPSDDLTAPFRYVESFFGAHPDT